MKNRIKNSVITALKKAYEAGDLPSNDFPEINIEEPKNDTQGDFSSNIAMVMAKTQKMAPRKIAEAVTKNFDDTSVEKVEIAGPGFINFYLKSTSWQYILDEVYAKDEKFGSSEMGKGTKIQVEFVSANPTGPLHVGHGRGAAVGDSTARILSFAGYDVQKEYYINDSGRQINTLGISVFSRYKELAGKETEFPEDCYKGDYIIDLAKTVLEEKGQTLLEMDEQEAVTHCAKFAADNILKGIADDLGAFGVTFDNWYSEQTLYDSGKVDTAIEKLREEKIVYEQDGASWFRTTDYGDEKDRVIVRSNGQTTYFASDIAYHKDKFDRGFNRIIDVWGADHHGYINRINAAIEASGTTKDNFDVILIQLVTLLRDGKPIAMTTRGGIFETLKDVIDEVGSDAARFIFLSRSYESNLDFDLELAKKKTNDNPVYYVQYCHARISSIIRKAAEEKGIASIEQTEAGIARLVEPEDIAILKALARYAETIETAAAKLEPHKITYYLTNLASLFHSYFNKHKVLTDDTDLTKGRLYLIGAVKLVIKNGLSLLGVSAPDKM